MTMNISNIASMSPALSVSPSAPAELQAPANGDTSAKHEPLREAFTQFVGETFFGLMMKAMRSTVDKPAYFHGGQAEEVFRSQLDQTLSTHLTEATADRFAEPLFYRQFPHLKEVPTSNEGSTPRAEFADLEQLSRR